MLVRSFVDNQFELITVYLDGQVTKSQVIGVLADVAGMASKGRAYRSLLVLSSAADLSSLDPSALAAVKAEAQAVYGRLNLRRRAGAAVFDASHDTRTVVPLWNALSDPSPGMDLDCEFFDEVEPALAWLGIPAEARTAVTGMTG